MRSSLASNLEKRHIFLHHYCFSLLQREKCCVIYVFVKSEHTVDAALLCCYCLKDMPEGPHLRAPNGGEENRPQHDSSSLAVFQLFKVLRDKRKLCSWAAGACVQGSKRRQIMGVFFFFVAVSSADCRCCEDSFKRRETNSDGRGRAIRQLEATMILSNSSRGKSDSES